MSIKVIITDNNDILYNSLSDLALKIKEKIEIINIPNDKLKFLFHYIKTKENIILLDSSTSVRFCSNIIKNAILNKVSIDIVILVINSSTLNIIEHERYHSLLKKGDSEFLLLDLINLINNSLNDTIELENTIDTILWKMGFNSYFKGTIYLRDAIRFSYIDKKLLFDTQNLIKKVAEKNNIDNFNVVRSDIDKMLNNALDFIDISVIYNIFGDEYDGRKISLRYFIDLCVRHLEKKRNYIFE